MKQKDESPRQAKSWDHILGNWRSTYIVGECGHSPFKLDGKTYCSLCGEEMGGSSK